MASQTNTENLERQQEIQNAQAQIAILEQQKATLSSRLAEISDESSKRGVQTVLNDINARISGAKTALQKITSAVDLIKKIPNGEITANDVNTAVDLVKNIPGVDAAVNKVADKMGSSIDKFLEKYGNKKFELVKTPKFSLTFPIGIPLITISGSAQLTLSAELASQRTGATITSQATLAAIFRGQIGIAIGVKILGKQVGVEGGISVSANAIGKSVITLSLAGTDLNASMNPADIEITASAALYLKWSFGKPINWAINELVDKFVIPSLKGTNRSGNQLNYPLGSIELLVVKTPVYSLTFNMLKGRFSTNKSGTFSCRIHPKLKARLDAIRKGIRR